MPVFIFISATGINLISILMRTAISTSFFLTHSIAWILYLCWSAYVRKRKCCRDNCDPLASGPVSSGQMHGESSEGQARWDLRKLSPRMIRKLPKIAYLIPSMTAVLSPLAFVISPYTSAETPLSTWSLVAEMQFRFTASEGNIHDTK